MPLHLEIVSNKHRELFDDDGTHVFGRNGGTIGRSLQNDWILPDPNRFISGRHATVDYKAGAYYLADMSTNGVYVNDEDEPIGRGNPRRLYNGDRLRMGDFEFYVRVDEGEDLAVPEEAPPSVAPDNIEQFVAEDFGETNVPLLDAEEMTGDAAFQSALFGHLSMTPEPDPAPQPASARTPAGAGHRQPRAARGNAAAPPPPRQHPRTVAAAKPATPRPAAAPRPSAAPQPSTAPPAAQNAAAEQVFAAFLDGLGLKRNEFHPSVDPAMLLRNAGQVMREFVAGVGQLLNSRANLKNAFELNQTTILPAQNNPLKLSGNTEACIRQLLVGGSGDYLGPREAVQEVCNDLLHHQDAFLDAMNHAFVQFADRFNPDELVNGFERTLKSKPLFGFNHERKYWQLYCELYPVMTEKGGGRFPEMFSEAFVKAYERKIAESKRADHVVEEDLAKTVAWTKPPKVPRRDGDLPGRAKA